MFNSTNFIHSLRKRDNRCRLGRDLLVHDVLHDKERLCRRVSSQHRFTHRVDVVACTERFR